MGRPSSRGHGARVNRSSRTELILRSICPVLDGAGWALCAAALVLPMTWAYTWAVPGASDDLWEVFAIVLLFAAPLASFATVGSIEGLTGKSVGRAFTGLVIRDRDGRALGRVRRLARGVLKHGGVVALIALGVEWSRAITPGDEVRLLSLAPLAMFAAVNAVTCLVREDRRSLLDLATGTRSTLVPSS